MNKNTIILTSIISILCLSCATNKECFGNIKNANQLSTKTKKLLCKNNDLLSVYNTYVDSIGQVKSIEILNKAETENYPVKKLIVSFQLQNTFGDKWEFSEENMNAPSFESIDELVDYTNKIKNNITTNIKNQNAKLKDTVRTINYDTIKTNF